MRLSVPRSSSESTRAVSSRKSGLPSAFSSASARCAGGTSACASSASTSSRLCSGVQRAELERERSRVAAAPRSACARAGRAVPREMTSTGASRSARPRCSITSSSGSSAHCTSSKTSTSGCACASCSAQSVTAHVSSPAVRPSSAAPSTPSATASRSATASLSQHRRSFSNASDGGRVVADPGRGLDHRRERPVGDALAVGQRTTAQRGHALGALDELGDEPRLADARLAEDGDEARAAVADRARERVLEQLELLLAADEPRVRDTALRIQGADRAPRPERLLAALDLDRPGVLDLDRACGEAAHDRAEHDLARLRRLLQARRQVHGLTGGERGRGRVVDDDLAGLDADARLEPELAHLRPSPRRRRGGRAGRRPRACAERRTRP